MNDRRLFLGQVAAAAGAAFMSNRAESNTVPAADTPDGPPTPAVLPPSKPSGSPLGSIYPFVESQADRLTFPLSFTNDAFRDVTAWKAQARAELMALLQYSPEKCDPQAEVVRRVERDGYLQEDFSFRTTPDLRVPASLLIPNNHTGKAPGVVALHDHGGFYLWGRDKILENDREHPVLTDFRARYYGGKSIAAELARQGYVVLTIDMFYWGERRLMLDDDPADWRERRLTMPAARVQEFNARSGREEPFVARALMTAGITWPGVMLWDDIRSLDYLATRPEVDPERLACVGLSVGGLRSMYLSALDDRIKAAVICGWMASHPAQLKAHLRHSIGFTKLIPGMTRLMDYPDVASLAMPRPILVINGAKDALFEPGGVKSSFDKLTTCYAKAGVPERFKGTMYDTPHEFNTEMQAEAWAWLKRWV